MARRANQSRKRGLGRRKRLTLRRKILAQYTSSVGYVDIRAGVPKGMVHVISGSQSRSMGVPCPSAMTGFLWTSSGFVPIFHGIVATELEAASATNSNATENADPSAGDRCFGKTTSHDYATVFGIESDALSSQLSWPKVAKWICASGFNYRLARNQWLVDISPQAESELRALCQRGREIIEQQGEVRREWHRHKSDHQMADEHARRQLIAHAQGAGILELGRLANETNDSANQALLINVFESRLQRMPLRALVSLKPTEQWAQESIDATIAHRRELLAAKRAKEKAETSADCPFTTLRAAYANGWSKIKSDEYGEANCSLKGIC